MSCKRYPFHRIQRYYVPFSLVLFCHVPFCFVLLFLVYAIFSCLHHYLLFYHSLFPVSFFLVCYSAPAHYSIGSSSEEEKSRCTAKEVLFQVILQVRGCCMKFRPLCKSAVSHKKMPSGTLTQTILYTGCVKPVIVSRSYRV